MNVAAVLFVPTVSYNYKHKHGPTNNSVDFIVDSLDGLNITECPSMDTCASQPCINGGTCVQEVSHACVPIAILE